MNTNSPAISITDLLRRRGRKARPPTPRLHTGRAAHLPAADGEDMAFKRSNGPTAGVVCQICYVDAKGQESERRITIRRITQKGNDLLLVSWCHEREAWRTFYASRIEELVDLKTGEITSDPRVWLANIASMLGVAAEKRDDTDSAIREVLAAHKVPLHLLLFLARCDGQVHPSEQAILHEYVIEASPMVFHEKDRLDWYLDRVHPDVWVYNQALIGIRPWAEDQIISLMKHAQRLVHADGALTVEEQAFAIELSTAIMQR